MTAIPGETCPKCGQQIPQADQPSIYVEVIEKCPECGQPVWGDMIK